MVQLLANIKFRETDKIGKVQISQNHINTRKCHKLEINKKYV